MVYGNFRGKTTVYGMVYGILGWFMDFSREKRQFMKTSFSKLCIKMQPTVQGPSFKTFIFSCNSPETMEATRQILGQGGAFFNKMVCVVYGWFVEILRQNCTIPRNQLICILEQTFAQ